MYFLNIGYGNAVAVPRIIAVLNPNSEPVKRMINEAKKRNALIEANFGRKKRSALILDTGHIMMTALSPHVVLNRIEI